MSDVMIERVLKMFTVLGGVMFGAILALLISYAVTVVIIPFVRGIKCRLDWWQIRREAKRIRAQTHTNSDNKNKDKDRCER